MVGLCASPGVSAVPGRVVPPRLLANSLAASTLFGQVSQIAGHPRRWLIALRPPHAEEAQTTQRGSSQHPQGWSWPQFSEKHIEETQPPAAQFLLA